MRARRGWRSTLEDLFEVWTWGQLGYHAKPMGLLEVDGFYAQLEGCLDHLVAQGFVAAPHRAMLQVEDSPTALLDALAAWQPTVPPRWAEPAPR